jgi:hypothetical protein
MKEITISNLATINIEKLDGDLRSTLSSRYMGLSTRRGEVLVFMADDTPSAAVLEAQTLVENHDSAQLSAEQVAAIAEQEALADARAVNGTNLDTSQFAGESAALQTLANKLLWLEREIRDLQGL